MDIKFEFEKARFDPRTHLGLGDIRLSLSFQDEIISKIDLLRAENDELKDMLHRVRRAIKEIDDADCYVALQAALRGEPSK